MTTLHEYCTPEYTLTAMLAGTYSVAVVPVLQGRSKEALPKAFMPIAVTLEGRKIVVRPEQPEKALMPINLTLVVIVTDVMPEQPENAESATQVMVVEMTMSPLQHADDGSMLLTQVVVAVEVAASIVVYNK